MRTTAEIQERTDADTGRPAPDAVPESDAAPAPDSRILGMQEYYDEGRFYQGASKFIPLSIPTENYLQAIVTGADPEATLARLDADWARLALRG